MTNIKIFKKHDVTCANDAEALIKEMNAGWEIHERFNGWVILSSPKSEETRESTAPYGLSRAQLQLAWSNGEHYAEFGKYSDPKNAYTFEDFIKGFPADPLDEHRKVLQHAWDKNMIKFVTNYGEEKAIMESFFKLIKIGV